MGATLAASSPFVQLVAAKTGLDPRVIGAWVQAEGGPTGNPLNIGPGRNYGSTQAAADATANLITGSHYYRGIMAARGNPSAQIAAIKASPWDASHYANGVLDRTSQGFGIHPGVSPVAAPPRTPTPLPAAPQGDAFLYGLLKRNSAMLGLAAPPPLPAASPAPAALPAPPSLPSVLAPSGLAGGFLPHGASYHVGRVDQGHDFQTNPGGFIIAPGDGVVESVKADPHGFGPSYPVVHFTSGPYQGRSIYIGHTLSTLRPGSRFRKGQTISRTGTTPIGNASVPGWAEIGYANNGLPAGWGKPPF